MLYNAAKLVAEGLLKPPVHVQFVLGIPGALPADREVLEFELAQLERMLPGATWTAAGIGRHQAEVMRWALARGADAVRTGLEDNIRVAKDRLARSNAELVSLAAEAIAKEGRRPATPAEARQLLGLRPSAGARAA